MIQRNLTEMQTSQYFTKKTAEINTTN